MADDFLDDKGQEFFCKIGIELRGPGECPKARDLFGFPRRIGRRQTVLRLIFPNLLCAFEALGKQMDERGIDIVDAVSQSEKFGIRRLCHRETRFGSALL
jgi:hypothetical protein